MKIYVAGPMRGIPDFNFSQFDVAANALRNVGHEVFSPVEHDRDTYGDTLLSPTGDHADTPGFDVREALGADLAYICAHAEAVVVLDGWEKSLGATAEVATARALGLNVLTPHEALYGTVEGVPETQPESPRGELLDGAKHLITGDRNNQYGPPTQDFSRTAGMASAFGFMVNGKALEAHHVAIFMILLKMSRLAWTPGKRDSWEDTAGYAGCGWEAALEEAKAAIESPLEEWERTLLNSADPGPIEMGRHA